MHRESRFHRLEIARENGVTILSLNEMDIWDGADVALLRDSLIALVNSENCRSIGIDLRGVQHIPTGFFGMLYAWHQKEVDVRLYQPHPRIQEMLWFRHFFEAQPEGGYLLTNKPPIDFIDQPEINWCEFSESVSAHLR
ncbi:MAG: hypothetical protein Tsb009_29660 [Planctomycetaceae bacterium]